MIEKTLEKYKLLKVQKYKYEASFIDKILLMISQYNQITNSYCWKLRE